MKLPMSWRFCRSDVEEVRLPESLAVSTFLCGGRGTAWVTAILPFYFEGTETPHAMNI
jgi:hypothetical protein